VGITRWLFDKRINKAVESAQEHFGPGETVQAATLCRSVVAPDAQPLEMAAMVTDRQAYVFPIHPITTKVEPPYKSPLASVRLDGDLLWVGEWGMAPMPAEKHPETIVQAAQQAAAAQA
jgi:hypothetical protein